ncbi:MAG: protocatechuate 3,4-dioxygenase subunit alpha [Burkholderiales bacterium]
MSLHATTSQTVGPYLHIGLTWLITESLAPAGVPGERVTIRGRVLDGDGKLVNDALVEIWQADSRGKYGGKRFRGFGRSATDDAGEFRFHTIKPGRVPGPVVESPGQLQAPHILVVVFMRGQLKQLVSRIYFPDEPANARDAVLALVPKERRATLIARKTGKPGVLEWNAILQGKNETVFFDC